MWHDWPIYPAVPYIGSKMVPYTGIHSRQLKEIKHRKKQRKYLSAFIAGFCLVRASRLPASPLARRGDGASTAGEEAAAIVLIKRPR